MIRKKKFMAIAVASLFVAPVMANSDDYTLTSSDFLLSTLRGELTT